MIKTLLDFCAIGILVGAGCWGAFLAFAVFYQRVGEAAFIWVTIAVLIIWALRRVSKI